MSEQQTIGWAVVEMFGHRRAAGYVTEATVAGAGFLRLDIPATDDHAPQTQLVNPASVYALHPVGEVTARAAAARWRPEPVHRWELPALAAPPTPDVAPNSAEAADYQAFVELDDPDDDPWGTGSRGSQSS